MDSGSFPKIPNFPVKDLLGEGGMAWVYEAWDEKWDRPCAVKVLKPQFASGELWREFEAESKRLSQFKHQNLVQIYDRGKDEAAGLYWYAMELVRGSNLHAEGQLSLEDAVRIYREALEGLAELHRKHLVHRDIKPANILLCDDGRVLVSDLGISRDELTSNDRTQVMGTALYISPEQASGRRALASADVFSMGLSLYWSLAEHSAYATVEGIDLKKDHAVLFYLGGLDRAGAEVEFSFPDGFDPRISKLIAKATRMKPGDRYQDAKEMQEALARAFPSSSGHVPEIAARSLWRRIHLSLLAGGLFLSLAFGGTTAWRWNQTRVNQQRLVAAGAHWEQASGVVGEVQRLAPLLPDPTLVEKLSQRLIDLQSELEASRSQVAEGQVAELGSALAGIRKGLAEVCQEARRSVHPIVEDARGRLDTGLRKLEHAGVGALYPERLAELKRSVAETLQPPASGAAAAGDAACAAAATDVARLDRIEASGSQAREQLEQVRAAWIARLSSQWLSAESAERSSRSLVSRDPRVRAEVEAGSLALAESRTLQEEESFEQAETQLRRAREYFIAALEMGTTSVRLPDVSARPPAGAVVTSASVLPVSAPVPAVLVAKALELELTPASSTQKMKLGSTQSFRALARNTQGPVSLRVVVDQQEVATSSSPDFEFRYAPAASGPHTLEFQAVDARSESTSRIVSVSVEDELDAGRVAEEVLERYRNAYQRGSLAEMQGVRVLSEIQRDSMGAYFAEHPASAVQTQLIDAKHQDGIVIATFRQTINGETRQMRAEISRKDGVWRIATMKGG